ncbi:MalY/PatB family protein [Dehalogenimonas etheniformans]|uniref:cysteine-S-conjugate beta-lyase n=2 Tax=Dehalogenimonas etheniformans TaxID=1536648 RepID=A0A2P5P5I8_9CHLR|nr:MalY/PatB family protein [Dehalogenimonas etheniformans]PPD57550.1 pyridoxal phosphate-dependent aminotransferase [Dehalogenimonas etheniformans]QNT77178.1 pyridoxal phosphate-dependent aminotransferase [Dehalogenimonas etheniformans]
MKYDFDRLIDRTGTNCVKWDMRREVFGTDDLIPMWVADMDFAVAEPITAALRKRTAHPIYGYTSPSPSLIEAVVDRLRRKYNWKVNPEWVVFTPGVIPAIAAALKALIHPGDSVVINDPIYHPFWALVAGAGCRVAASPMKFEGGRYEMDFGDLKRLFSTPHPGFMAPPQPKAKILCNPHNPVGRVYTPDEQRKIGEIAIDSGAIVISDEVHCELLFDGTKHTPFATLSEEFAQNSITCMSASKTFNLAGLAASVIIIPNAHLRADFQTARAGIMPQPDSMALAALEAAFRDGDEWLQQLLAYLQGNLDFLVDFFEKRIPKIKVVRPQGTYLVWLDCRGLGLDSKALRNFFIHQARVGLDEGCRFGPHGEGFMRMNIACPRSTLEEALTRIEKAVNGQVQSL